jgi:transposase-like protein
MPDWFDIALGAMVIAIAGAIVLAVRKTKAEIDRGLGPAPTERDMKRRIRQIRARDVRCPRCGRQSHAMLGMKNRYKCDTCNHAFEDSLTGSNGA